GPDDALLGRFDNTGARYYYATDKLGSVLSIYREDTAGLTPMKTLAYDRTFVTSRIPENSYGPVLHDRFEYAGLEYDPATRMVLNSSGWFDAKSGRYTGQNGPGLGNNPYPVSGNDAPNVSPAEAEPPTLTSTLVSMVRDKLQPLEDMGGGLGQAAGF